MSSNTKEHHTMRTALGGVALLLTLTAVAGCGDDDPVSKPSASSTPASPSPSASPTNPIDVAHAAAQAAMQRYIAGVNAVAQKPNTFPSLSKVAAGSAVLEQRNEARYFIKKGWHGTGTGTQIVKMKVAGDFLGEKPPYVQLNVCTTFSGELVDKTGKVVNVGKRPKYRTSLYTVANYGKKLGWLVTTQKDNDNGSSSCEF